MRFLLIQRSPTKCGVSECDREASLISWLCPTRGCCATGESLLEKVHLKDLKEIPKDNIKSIRATVIHYRKW